MDLILIWLAVVALSAFLCWIPVIFLSPNNEKWPILITFLGLGAIAATAGYTGGLSRVGVVGNVMSAALGLLGGVVVYLFASDRSKGTIVSLCAIVFSLALFLSYFDAATRRGKPERYAFWRKECLRFYSDKDALNDPLAMLVADKSFGEICGRVFNSERRLLLDH